MMALDFHTTEVPFGFGMDQGTHSYAIAPPKVRNLINGRVNKLGAISPRPGWNFVTDFEVPFGQGTRAGDLKLFSAFGNLFCVEGVTNAPAPMQLGIVQLDEERTDRLIGAGGTRSLSEVQVLSRDPMLRPLDNTFSTCPDYCFDPATQTVVVAWQQGVQGRAASGIPRIFATVIDALTREPIVEVQEISFPSGDSAGTFFCVHPHVVRQGSEFFVVYIYTNQFSYAEVHCVPYDATTRTWGTDTVLFTDAYVTTVSDATNFDGSEATGWFLSYMAIDADVPNLKWIYMNGTTAVHTVSFTVSATAVGILTDTNSAWIAFYDATGAVVQYSVRSTDLSTVALGQTTILPSEAGLVAQIGIVKLDPSDAMIVWSENPVAADLTGSTPNGRPLTRMIRRNLSGAGGGFDYAIDSVEMISKPYYGPNGLAYVNVMYNGSGKNTVLATSVAAGRTSQGFSAAFTLALGCQSDLLGDTSTAISATHLFRPVASWAYGFGGTQRDFSTLSRCGPVNSEVNFALQTFSPETIPDSGSVLASSVDGTRGVDMCRMNISATNEVPIFATSIGRNLVFSGGVPQVFDGQTLTEYGFLTPPDGATFTTDTSAGALSTGNYSVNITWDYMLATGDLMRSAPLLARVNTTSVPIIAVTGPPGEIALQVPPLRLTSKRSDLDRGLSTFNTETSHPAVAHAWRTLANGSQFYDEGGASITPGMNGLRPNLVYLPLNGNIGGSTASPTWDLIASDLRLQQEATLYTTSTVPNILGNYPPPALGHLTTHRERIFGISQEDARVIYFTQQYEPGALPGWHPDLVLQLEEPATALASLDANLLIFTLTGIYVLQGDGPDHAGLNSSFMLPQRLNAPYGCVDARTLASYPYGVFFQSYTGICMIDRSLAVTRVGGPVEDALAVVPFIVSAQAYDKTERVYFCALNAPLATEATMGAILVYDWRHDQWSIDDVQGTGELGPVALQITAIALVDGDLFGALAPAEIYVHEGVADPANTFIYMQLESAWISLGNMHGFQRCRWISLLSDQSAGAYSMALKLFVDYVDSVTPAQSFSWSAADIAALGSRPQLKMHVAPQRSSVTKVILETADGGGGPALGPTFTGIGFDIGRKNDMVKLPQAAMR